MLGYQKINPTHQGDLSMSRKLVQSMPIWPNTSVANTTIAELLANPTKGWFEGLDPLADIFPQTSQVSTRTTPFFPAIGNGGRLVPFGQPDAIGLIKTAPPNMNNTADRIYWRRPFALHAADTHTLQAMGKQIAGMLKPGGFVEFRLLQPSDKARVLEMAKEIPGAEIIEVRKTAIQRFLKTNSLPANTQQAEILQNAKADMNGDFSPKGGGAFDAIIRVYKR